MSARVLVTGITSIHGWPIYTALRKTLGTQGVYGLRPPKTAAPDGENVASVCMTDTGALADVRESFRPDLVIHAGGVCDLDVCEERPEWAQELNVDGAKNVTDQFADVPIVFLSTDLVFSGNAHPPRGYTEDCPTDPVSVVGRTFLAAEEEIARAPRHAILRLGLPIGDSVQGTKGAVDWIEGRYRRGLRATLFHDECRSGIDCDELARCVLEFIERDGQGLYHLGGPRAFSLYEIGQRVLERGPYDSELLDTCSRLDEVDGPPRVGNVGLNSNRLETLLGRAIRPCQWETTHEARR